MKIKPETRDLILGIIGCTILVLFVVGIFFGFYWMLFEFILKCLNIIFNHK